MVIKCKEADCGQVKDKKILNAENAHERKANVAREGIPFGTIETL